MSDTTACLSDLYSPIRDDLIRARDVFDAELASDHDFINDLCDTVRSYRGKMLRPALLLLAGRACGKVTPQHHTLAAVVEMIHMATLVHDDVLDEADERRGLSPVHEVVGNVAAVLLGDYLISHSYHLCSGLGSQRAARLVGAATNLVCTGELLQSQHRGDVSLSESQYVDIIRRKTGTLTAVSCRLGAIFADADSTTCEALYEYGMSCGVAFQIVDDLLDIAGDRSMVRKTLGIDLASGKLTLPVIHCLAHATDATCDAIRSVVRGETKCNRSLLRRWLGETGSVEYADAAAKSYIADARTRLDVLPPSEPKSSLTAMVEFIVQRQS